MDQVDVQLSQLSALVISYITIIKPRYIMVTVYNVSYLSTDFTLISGTMQKDFSCFIRQMLRYLEVKGPNSMENA